MLSALNFHGKPSKSLFDLRNDASFPYFDFSSTESFLVNCGLKSCLRSHRFGQASRFPSESKHFLHQFWPGYTGFYRIRRRGLRSCSARSHSRSISRTSRRRCRTTDRSTISWVSAKSIGTCEARPASRPVPVPDYFDETVAVASKIRARHVRVSVQVRRAQL